MKLNTLPGTDLRISEISFGAGTAAGLMVSGTRAEQTRAVAAAIDRGLNHFDTASVYGFGASETNLGAVLKDLKADVVLTTKFNLPREYLSEGGIRSRMKLMVRESLVRLQRSHIDVFLVHNATHRQRNYRTTANPSLSALGDILPHISMEDLLGPDGVWEVAQELKRDGLIRYFGISGQDNDPDVVRVAIEARQIDVFNQPFNLMNPSAGFATARKGEKTPAKFSDAQADYIDFDDILDFADKHKVGAAVISPLAAGLLTDEAQNDVPAPEISDRGPRFPREGQYQREIALARRFFGIARQHDMGLAELAYRFVLSAPGVVTALGGFSSSEQMIQAVDAAEKGPLGQDVLDALHRAWFETQ